MSLSHVLHFHSRELGGSERLTASAKVTQPVGGGAAWLWQSGSEYHREVAKLLLTAFNLGHSYLKQTAFPEKTDI